MPAEDPPLGLEYCDTALRKAAFNDIVLQFQRFGHALPQEARPVLSGWLMKRAAEARRRAGEALARHQPLSETELNRLKQRAMRQANLGNPLQDAAHTCVRCGALLWGARAESRKQALDWRSVNEVTGALPPDVAIRHRQQSGRLLVEAHKLDRANPAIHEQLNELDARPPSHNSPPQFAWPKKGQRSGDEEVRLERARRVWSWIGRGLGIFLATGMAVGLCGLAASLRQPMYVVPVLTAGFAIALWKVMGKKKPAQFALGVQSAVAPRGTTI